MDDDEKWIPELGLLGDITAFCREYEKKHGVYPISLSEWDPSSYFKEALVGFDLIDRGKEDFVTYLFSSTISQDIKKRICDKLGISLKSKSTLFTPSGSASILNLINCYARNGIDKIVLLNPTYFTVKYALNIYGIHFTDIYLKKDYEFGKFYISEKDKKIIEQHSALWLTNPIYCTSVFYDLETIQYFERLLDGGMEILSDESDCPIGMELSRYLGKFENFSGIYSPHKSICVNALKFSLICSKLEHQPIFNHWSDVLYGCLSASNRHAMLHFISDNYDHYCQKFNTLISDAKEYVIQCSAESAYAHIDLEQSGYLMSVYFPCLSSNYTNEQQLLHDIIQQCGVYVIPGSRSKFDPDMGFTFRLNLASDSPQFRTGVSSLIRYLDAICAML